VADRFRASKTELQHATESLVLAMRIACKRSIHNEN